MHKSYWAISILDLILLNEDLLYLCIGPLKNFAVNWDGTNLDWKCLHARAMHFA